MSERIKKKAALGLFLWTFFQIMPSPGTAAIAVEEKVASGTISQFEANHAVRLDNGSVYQPSRQGLAISDIQIGQPVTLLYVIQPDGSKMFFKYAPGLNSLKTKAPQSEATHQPK